MTAQIYQIMPAATLSQLICRETQLGKATTPEAIIEAAEELNNTLPAHDLALAVWRQSLSLPPGRQAQIIDEIDFLLN